MRQCHICMIMFTIIFGVLYYPILASGQEDESQDICSLYAQHSIDVHVRGDSVMAVRLAIKNETEDPIKVLIPVGTYFSSSKSENDMVCISTMEVDLDAQAIDGFLVPATSVHYMFDSPLQYDVLTLHSCGHSPSLTAVLKLLEEDKADFTVIAAAALILNSDADYYYLGYLSHVAPGEYYDRERAIKYAEVASAMLYLYKSGYDVRSRKVWGERKSILRKLEDQSLHDQFADMINSYKK